jgi:hypothetical protein
VLLTSIGPTPVSQQVWVLLYVCDAHKESVMGHINGGSGLEQARCEAVGRSLGILEDEVYEQGYEPDPHGFTQQTLDGRYRAIAWSPNNKRAEAIGNTPVAAAQSLVRSLRLPPAPRRRRHQGNYQR